jgi:D-alanyl-D-alanine carboxypeptidase
MVAADKADGVYLQPLSAFRSVDDQNYLFFDVKAQRGEVATERARVSAPPGHSEHHTGYAIDIGDATQPSANLQLKFDQTPAFKWLVVHAAHYSFELSFPENNPQGVSYEPWHWRFVGDRSSLETFYRARQLKSGK